MSIHDLLYRRFPFMGTDNPGGAPDTDPAEVVDQIVNGDPPEEENPDEIDPDTDLGLDPDEPAQEPEWEDVDFDQAKIRVPKGMSQKVLDGLMLRADHTKKTQEVAELRKRFEAREKALQERTEYDDQISEGTIHLKMMDNDLKEEYKYLQSPEFRNLWNEDFPAAYARQERFKEKREQRGQLAGALQALAQERNSKLALAEEAAKAEANKRREQLPQEIAKIVPGWNAEMAGKVKEYALSSGYTPEALDSSTEPIHWKTLHEAMIGRMYLDAKARKASGAVVPKPAGATKTVGQRGGGSSVDVEKMTGDQYRQHFLREQQAKRARK